MQVTDHGQAVWTLLIEHSFERVGKDGSDDGSYQYMIACASHLYVPGPRVKPPAHSNHAKHVVVGTHV